VADGETLGRWRAATDRRITRDGAGDELTVRMTRRYDAPVGEVWLEPLWAVAVIP
jgi:hypothetical protein